MGANDAQVIYGFHYGRYAMLNGLMAQMNIAMIVDVVGEVKILIVKVVQNKYYRSISKYFISTQSKLITL